MTKEEMKRLYLTPIEDYITEDFGEIGSPSRMEFEASAIIGLLFLIFLANIVVLTEISRIMRKFVPEFENF